MNGQQHKQPVEDGPHFLATQDWNGNRIGQKSNDPNDSLKDILKDPGDDGAGMNGVH